MTVLDGGDKIAGFQQAVAIAGVEPGKATAEELHFQRALVQIETVEVGNFVFAASRGLQGGGFLCHGGVVEVQSGDGIVAFRIGRLFFQRDGFAVGIKLHYTVGTGVLDVITKDAGTLVYGSGTLQHGGEALTVEHVVAQNKAARSAVQELCTQHKGLCQSVGILLYLIGKGHTEFFAGSQQLAEHG